ncbi:MAG TPA: hypothetical protein VIF62_08390, partial [Labilithrix sp.]
NTAPPPPSDAAADGPPTLDPDAAPPAGCPDGCLPPAPVGWTGPSAVYDGAGDGKPAACLAPYTNQELDTFVGLTAAPATCNCGAAIVMGRKCTASIASFSNGTCTSIPTLEGSGSNVSGCASVNSGNPYFKVQTPVLVPGTCSFPNAMSSKPDPTFDKRELACGLAQVTACASRADCVGTPALPGVFNRICIHKDGDVSCPAQDYAQRFVAYKIQALADTRACSPCAATPTGGACGTSWGLSGNVSECMSAFPPTDHAVGTCYGTSPSMLVNLAAIGPSDGTCTPAGGTPTGSATASDPVTYCCNR